MLINHYHINCFNSETELCYLGAKYGTDKSPVFSDLTKNYYNQDYRHSYTPFYSFLFSNIRNKKITLGEIGIAQNSSIKMWRNYFPKALIYAWDGSIENIENGKNDKLPNVIYDYMHTSDEECIKNAFLTCNSKFDVLIDDASHFFWDQIKIIRLCPNYLKRGSFLIIEDIDKTNSNDSYIERIIEYGHDQYYDEISFIEFHHQNKNLGEYDNDKIILLKRSCK